MSEGGGISGTAVALSTVGGVLLWSAIANRTPVDLVRQALGKPTSGASVGPGFGTVEESTKRAFRDFGAGSGQRAEAVGGGAGLLVSEARKHLGARYVWATAGPVTFDCSGLVVYCLRQVNVADVPRFTTYSFGAWAQKHGAVRVTPEQFRAGDIILRTGHMAIATSNTRMVHAPNPTTVVKEEGIYSPSTWWGWRLWGSTSTIKEG